MSETWGPRAHPERCCEDIDPDDPTVRHRRVNQQVTWTWLLLAIVALGVVVATRENWWAAVLAWWREVSGVWG